MCLSRLPSALSAYDGFNDACSTVEKVETLLSNKFDSLTDQTKDLLRTSSDIKTSQAKIQDLRKSLSAKIFLTCVPKIKHFKKDYSMHHLSLLASVIQLTPLK